ncbi:MAG: M1 family metallopeptidase [Psychroflexus halocasei]
MFRIYCIISILLLSFSVQSQILTKKRNHFSEADSLRGSLRPERISYDVKKYDLKVKVEPGKKYISGVNRMDFIVKENTNRIQVDLFENMNLDSVVYQKNQMDFDRKFNAVFINFKEELKASDKLKNIRFYFSGYPIVAERAPWDGGFVFDKDKNGNHFIATAVQGVGASLWFPNKDHPADEPDEVTVTIINPSNLIGVSNGRLTNTEKLIDGFTAYTWEVKNPINNYNISVNIADYAHFSDQFDDLDLDYYVLSYNLEKAKKQFQQVKPMLACFEEKFGAYAFYEDGYKLIETPYLGMEHQSAVAYGNGYKNGYLGRDLSNTGVGLKWDFIIIHESAHEWFGNSISSSDIADMWIHESFTTYAESVYVECQFGYDDAVKYLNGLRPLIANDSPIQGVYGVHNEGSSDMYYKGANMLHTIRSVVNNDELWWETLKEFHLNFQYQTIDKKQVITFFNEKLDMNLSSVFEHYITLAEIPTLEYRIAKNNELLLRWKSPITDFQMPIDYFIKSDKHRTMISSDQWINTNLKVRKNKDLNFDTTSFYIKTKRVSQ